MHPNSFEMQKVREISQKKACASRSLTIWWEENDREKLSNGKKEMQRQEKIFDVKKIQNKTKEVL